VKHARTVDLSGLVLLVLDLPTVPDPMLLVLDLPTVPDPMLLVLDLPTVRTRCCRRTPIPKPADAR